MHPVVKCVEKLDVRSRRNSVTVPNLAKELLKARNVLLGGVHCLSRVEVGSSRFRKRPFYKKAGFAILCDS